jgi:hypothetical protein
VNAALVEVIGTMDGSTLIYPGHEYTVSNLLYAKDIEPDSVAVGVCGLSIERADTMRGSDVVEQTKLLDAETKRARNEPTIPTTLTEELVPSLSCLSVWLLLRRCPTVVQSVPAGGAPGGGGGRWSGCQPAGGRHGGGARTQGLVEAPRCVMGEQKEGCDEICSKKTHESYR